MTGALCVFTRTEAEVEAQLDQVGNMTGFGVEGGGCHGHDGLENSERDGLFLFDRRFLDVVGFKLMSEASVQSSVGLVVWRLSRVREAIQEVGFRNRPPWLIDQIFPKSVQALLGVVVMSDPVSEYL